MTEPLRDATPSDADQHSVLAEEVRAFLVSVRGGAPFLSSADGRLLVAWLDQGVPVTAILSAIERTAQRRAGKRLRTRMTLGACKGEVKKLIGTPKTPRARPSSGASSAHSPSVDALSREVRRIASTEMPPEAVPARDALVHRLSALLRTTTPPSDLATVAASAVCTFHEDLWSATLPLHTALHAQAREKLAPLQTVVTAKVFADLIDEHTRQAVRALAPGVAVEPIWKALGTGAS